MSLGAGGKKSKRAVAAEEKGRKSCSFAAEEKGRKNCSVAAEKKGRKSCSVAALKGCLLTTWLYSFCLQREEVKQPYSLPLMVCYHQTSNQAEPSGHERCYAVYYVGV